MPQWTVVDLAVFFTLVEVWTNKEVVSEVGRVPVIRGCGPRVVGSVEGTCRSCGKILLPLPTTYQRVERHDSKRTQS